MDFRPKQTGFNDNEYSHNKEQKDINLTQTHFQIIVAGNGESQN